MKVEQFVMAYGVEQDRVRAILPAGFESLRPVLRINAEIRDDKIGYLEFNAPAEKDSKRGWVNIGNWSNVEFDKRELPIDDSTNLDNGCDNRLDDSTNIDNGCGNRLEKSTKPSSGYNRDARNTTSNSVSNDVNKSLCRIETVFRLENLELAFTRVGIESGCPAEKDNEGCFFRCKPQTPDKCEVNAVFEDNDREQGSCGEAQEDYMKWAFRKAEIVTSNKEFCDCEFRWNFDGEGARGKSIGETIPAFLEKQENTYSRDEFTVKNAAVIPCKDEKVLGAYVVEFER